MQWLEPRRVEYDRRRIAMLEFALPPPRDEILFEAILEPTAAALKKLEKREAIGEGVLATFRGKENRVAVGVPYYENLISRYTEQAIKIPHEIRKQMDEYDFHFVSLSCSFLPDTGCKFLWARFGIELSAQSESGELLEQPTAFDMFPEEVLTVLKYRRVLSVSPGLKLNLGIVNAGTDISVRTEKDVTVYEPQIIAFGINMSNAAWDLKSTQEKGIWGNKRDLLLAVKSPKNSKVKGRFLLGAEVEFRLVRIPISKRKDEIVDVEYDLSG
jgi:hypothetical protein